MISACLCVFFAILQVTTSIFISGYVGQAAWPGTSREPEICFNGSIAKVGIFILFSLMVINFFCYLLQWVFRIFFMLAALFIVLRHPENHLWQNGQLYEFDE